MEMNYEDLGRRIRECRKRKKMTQEELAEKTNISASFLGHIERGTRVASVETLVALCNALSVKADYLLAASLTTFDEHLPARLSNVDRTRLAELFRLAQDTLGDWED